MGLLAALEMKAIFLTPFVFRLLQSLNRSTDLTDYQICMLVFCCSPRSQNFKMLPLRSPLFKQLLFVNCLSFQKLSVAITKSGLKVQTDTPP